MGLIDNEKAVWDLSIVFWWEVPKVWVSLMFLHFGLETNFIKQESSYFDIVWSKGDNFKLHHAPKKKKKKKKRRKLIEKKRILIENCSPETHCYYSLSEGYINNTAV